MKHKETKTVWDVLFGNHHWYRKMTKKKWYCVHHRDYTYWTTEVFPNEEPHVVKTEDWSK